MYLPLKFLSLVSATVLLSLSSLLPPTGTTPEIARVLAQTSATQDRKAEADGLLRKGNQQFLNSQFRDALQTYQQVLEIRKELNDKAGVGQTLNAIGQVYLNLGKYTQALELYQQALTIHQQVGNKAMEGTTLNDIGLVYFNQGNYGKALEFYQQALSIHQQVGNKAEEGTTLNNIGLVYFNQGEYGKALEFYQQALAIHQQVGNKAMEGTTLNNIGQVYLQQGNYDKALEFYQQALAIHQQVGNKTVAGTTLNNIGLVYLYQGNYGKALEFYQQALAIHQQVGNKAMEGTTLNNIGEVYRNQGEYGKALEFYQQALAIHQQVGNKTVAGTTLNNIGLVYLYQGNYGKALEFYQQALAIHKQVGNKAMEGTTLNNIGLVYLYQGNYGKALEFYQQALAIHKQVSNKAMEGTTLNNIGEVYRSLGEYGKALEFYQQALAIHQQIGNKAMEGTTLNNIGEVYRNQGEYGKALEFYQQALAIHQQVGNKTVAGTTLNNIGLVYFYQGNYGKALEFYQQALAIHQQVGNKAEEGTTLNNIGLVYFNQGEYGKALEFYQQALAIHQQVGNKEGQGITLGSIGYLLAQQNQPELAIVFYKQSVNVRQAIRQDIRGLTQEEQESYTKTVAGTYRQLANLLLKQNRVLEAQQVLDLLKVQEVQDYLGNVSNTSQTARDVNLLSTEQHVSTQYTAIQDQVIALGKELTALRNIPEANRTPAQQQRIAELVKHEETVRQEFNSFMKSPAVIALTQQIKTTSAGQNLVLENLNKLRSSLRQLQQNAVLLYPLVLEDRLEIVLVTADTPPIHRSVAVKKDDLSKAIVQFRAALQNPSRDAQVSGQQLYQWLIKPIEQDLTQAQAQTLIYAPDGQLRYIPLAALYDGKQWLVQRFRINNITAASLTDLTAKPHISPRVLAAAFTQGTYTVQLGNRQVPFSGLQFAGKEVDDVAAMIPNTTKLLNGQFSRDATVPRLNDYNIIHFATHAAFVKGQPEDSFILFGNGDRVTLPDVGKWSLPNVDLVVLSACQTALGGQLGDGEEILGLGYQMQQAGAKAALATLWTVDDGGTQRLMDVFYTLLKQSKVSKAEALRQAQIALITGNYQALGEQQGIRVRERIPADLPTTVTSQLSHPYYWAPFILIGNGL